MDRTRNEPLGVPDAGYHTLPDVAADRNSPKGIDRWLVSQIVKRLDHSSIRVVALGRARCRATRWHRRRPDP